MKANDNRRALDYGAKLPFPSMEITVTGEIGRGSNAIVYEGKYPDLHTDAMHRVVVKELFPYHQRGLITRGDGGEICVEQDAVPYYQFHKQSFEKGNKIHLGLLELSPDGVGGNVNTFEYNGTLYTVLSYSGGCTLEKEMREKEASLARMLKLLKLLLEALNDLHGNGLLHLDIAPDNVMLLGEGERERIILIDYNSVQEIGGVPSNISIKQGYSAPEVIVGDCSELCPATDLYSVTALFFRWLRGTPLTPFETTQRVPPSVSDSPVMKGVPETAASMVKQILGKGLRSVASRRYRSTAEMLTDLHELEDRINGVGITHWALWESGKKTVSSLIRSNSAYRYLSENRELFSLYAKGDDGEERPINSYINRLMSGGKNLYVTGRGGMGKTTSMLAAIQRGTEKYIPGTPAVIYIPLRERSQSQDNYITDKILEGLHFKSDVTRYDQARHALRQLLGEADKKGNPVAVLFLDGLNEAGERIDTLLAEIALFSKMSGVRMYITSRTEQRLEGFEYPVMSPLSADEVRRTLSSRHLLLPESAQMQEMLRTPIMLSMFIGLSEQTEKQPSAKTEAELLDAYIDSLAQKELSALAEDSPERAKIDVAINLVLPRVAEKLQKAGGVLRDGELLKEVTACYKFIKSPLLIKAFPQWIGCRAAIFDNAKSYDEWYETEICSILWRRLGLLIKNENGGYSILHQIVGDHLAEKYIPIRRRVLRYQTVKRALVASLCVALAVAVSIPARFVYERLTYEPQLPPAVEHLEPFDESAAMNVMSIGVMGYQRAEYQYVAIMKLLEIPEEQYLANRGSYDSSLSMIYSGYNEKTEDIVDQMMGTGDVMPWSEEAFRKDEFMSLYGFTYDRESEYAKFVAILDYLMNNSVANGLYGSEYRGMLAELAELDARIAATLYAISCRAHVGGMLDACKNSEDSLVRYDAQSVEVARNSVINLNKMLPESNELSVLTELLGTLLGQREKLIRDIEGHGACISYNKHGK